MATFSENQVRQLYVVNAANDFTVTKDKDGALHFSMLNAQGETITSDTIENIMYAKATPSSKMNRLAKTIKVEIDTNTLVDNGPIAGEDYVLRVEYTNFIAKSDETFYHEFASAHARVNSSVSDVLLELAKNLAKSAKAQGMIKVLVEVSGSPVEVKNYTSGTVTAIFVQEIPQTQGYEQGLRSVEPVYFTVSTGTVALDGDEVQWGTISDTTASANVKIVNGYTIADMEYFYHGERGDLYRNAGWPNVVTTKYMANPASEYDVIDIHYAYVGSNHAVQKSEKDITIACPYAGTDAHTVANGVIAKINTAYGSTLISTLS